MKKYVLLITVLTVLLPYNIISQMQNKWAVVDSLDDVFKIPDYPDYNIYFQIAQTNGPHKKISYFDKDNIIVLASWRVEEPQYIIRKTSDGGANWITIYRDTTKYYENQFEMELIDIYHPASNKIILSGYNRVSFQIDGKTVNKYIYFIKNSDDLCKTWNTIELDTNRYITALYMVDSSYGAVVTGNRSSGSDSLLITKDGLKTFSSISLPSFINNIEDIFCISKNYFYLINNNNEEKISNAYKTEDGGQNWTLVNTPLNKYIYQMKFFNANYGFIRYDNDLFRTFDGGKSWEKLISKGENTLIVSESDFDFADENNGIIISPGYNVYLTKDGGKNWFREDIPYITNFYAAAIYPPKGTPLIGYADYFICKRTENKIFKAPEINLLDYADRYILPKGNKIFWENISGPTKYQLLIYQTNYTNFDLRKFADTVVSDTSIVLDLNYKCYYYFQIRAFNDTLSSEMSGQQSAVYVVGDSTELLSPKILYPRVKGIGYPSEFTAKWTTEARVDAFDIELYQSKEKFFVGEDPNYKILSLYNYTDSSLFINNLIADSIYYLYVRCIKDGKVSRWAGKGFHILTTVSSEETIIINNKILCYPNPSTGVINLRYRIETAGMVNIFLTDILGKQTLLKSEYIFPGDYVETFNLNVYPQGIYNVVLQSGDKVYSEKVSLIR